MEVRRYRAEDIEGMLQMLGEHLQETIYKDMEYKPSKTRQMLEMNLNNILVFMNVIEHEGRIVGALLAFARATYYSDDCNAYDHFFYVRPEVRSWKAVTTLVTQYKEWAIARKVRRAFLSNSMGVRIDEFARLCKMLGFEQVGTVHAMEIGNVR